MPLQVSVADAIASALAVGAGAAGPPPAISPDALAHCSATACPLPSAACVFKFARESGVCPCDGPPPCSCDCESPLKLSSVVQVKLS